MLLRVATIITLIISLSLQASQAQSVGVVLSGGGASGMAHIGVLKALEENGIPIDFITGSSIGALVGGMYAAGYSPEQIEMMLTSEKFMRVARGEIEEKFVYFFRKPSNSASWVSIKLNSDSNFLQTSIPTSFINPAALDLELMRALDPASAASEYNFDSLFVPFRCVASDIENKESILFKEGNLNFAVRASMSYPLYLKPLSKDGKLLFDGGLYNNFPTDIMRDEFAPEVIIGSNVSSNEAPPREDDFLSQLRNMVVSKTNYELLGDCCVLIEPEVGFGTFNFNRLEESIDSGYVAAMRQMEEIKEKVHRRIHAKLVQESRNNFNNKKIDLSFSDFKYTGLTKAQSSYVNLILKPGKKKKSIDFEQLEKRYYRVYENDKIERLFPYATLNPDSTYSLQLLVKKEKNLIIDFGGNVSSRPINTGYLGLTYNALNKTGSSFHANTYFGKLYTSVLAKARLDVPIKLPFYIEPVFAINRWNYFRSRATFFEANNSLFLIQNEQYAYLNGSFALSNKTKFTVGGGFLSLRDDYYQTSQFGQDDIADKTTFTGNTLYGIFEKNSLNAKLYANSGSELKISAQLTSGDETYLPGTTSNEERTLRKLHQWINLKASYDIYYKSTGTLRLGFYAEAVYSNLELFTNYTASSLRSPAFKPTPESSTLFLESFRAYQYAAIGQKVIFNVYKNVDLRLEGYVFQPYRFARNRNDEGLPPDDVYDLARRYTIATANAVYRSPLGPISVGMNYYYNVPEISVDDRTPLTFLFHFGYILFNAPALK